MKIDGTEFDFSKAKPVTYYYLEMQDTKGTTHRMGYKRCNEAVNELIRLHFGHNWIIITEPKKIKGMELDGWLFPVEKGRIK